MGANRFDLDVEHKTTTLLHADTCVILGPYSLNAATLVPTPMNLVNLTNNQVIARDTIHTDHSRQSHQREQDSQSKLVKDRA